VQTSPVRQASPSLQAVPSSAGASPGQAAVAPSQRSAWSQAPVAARHTRSAPSSAQRPSTGAPAATLHASQSDPAPPPHAPSQQTPSTQKPLAHSAAAAHASPPACHVKRRPRTRQASNGRSSS
jgi:hypothetical protein